MPAGPGGRRPGSRSWACAPMTEADRARPRRRAGSLNALQAGAAHGQVPARRGPGRLDRLDPEARRRLDRPRARRRPAGRGRRPGAPGARGPAAVGRAGRGQGQHGRGRPAHHRRLPGLRHRPRRAPRPGGGPAGRRRRDAGRHHQPRPVRHRPGRHPVALRRAPRRRAPGLGVRRLVVGVGRGRGPGRRAGSLGTDTAGSGRVPAALNGIAALKPTGPHRHPRGSCRPAARSTAWPPSRPPRPRRPWSRRSWPGRTPTTRGRAPPRTGRRLVALPGAAPRRRPGRGEPVVRRRHLAAAAHAAAEEAMAALGWELVEVDLDPVPGRRRCSTAAPSWPSGSRPSGEPCSGACRASTRWSPASSPRPRTSGLAGVRRHRAASGSCGPRPGRCGRRSTRWPSPSSPRRAIEDVAADPARHQPGAGHLHHFANLFDLCAAVAPVAPGPTGTRGASRCWRRRSPTPCLADLAQAEGGHRRRPAGVRRPGRPRGRRPPAGEALDHQVVEAAVVARHHPHGPAYALPGGRGPPARAGRRPGPGRR